MTIHSEIITDEVPADGRFYAQGEHVRRAPIKMKVDGGTRYEIGFTVCRMSAYVPDAAPIIAAALNTALEANSAAIALQDAAAGYAMMAAFHRDDHAKADEYARRYTLPAEFWRANSLSHFNEQAAKSARASLAARRLLGVE